MAGQCAKGGGVDCVRFVAAVIDELHGEVRIPAIKLPQDVAFHAPATARAALRLFRKAYEPLRVVRDGVVEPGDIAIVTLGKVAGPGHAVLIGAEPNTAWHATGDEVQRAGIGVLTRPPAHLYGIYRIEDKDRWLKSSCHS